MRSNPNATLTEADRVRLERLVNEAVSIAKWDSNGNIGHDPQVLFLRFEFLAHEILSFSGEKADPASLMSSKQLQVVERALTSLKKVGKFDADTILQALAVEIHAICAQPAVGY